MEMDLGRLCRAVVPIPLYRHYHVGAVYLYLYRHLWPSDEIYLVDFGGSHSNGCHDGQKEWGGMGQNYLPVSLLVLGFQAFLIIVCVAIYAVLVQNIALEDDIGSCAIWSCVGYTVLLCFTLFKTGSLAKSVFQAH